VEKMDQGALKLLHQVRERRYLTMVVEVSSILCQEAEEVPPRI
jgi:hypothetical protein